MSERRIDRERAAITAELATVRELLAAVPAGDVLGRRSLVARAAILERELAELPAIERGDDA